MYISAHASFKKQKDKYDQNGKNDRGANAGCKKWRAAEDSRGYSTAEEHTGYMLSYGGQNWRKMQIMHANEKYSRFCT